MRRIYIFLMHLARLFCYAHANYGDEVYMYDFCGKNPHTGD